MKIMQKKKEAWRTRLDVMQTAIGCRAKPEAAVRLGGGGCEGPGILLVRCAHRPRAAAAAAFASVS